MADRLDILARASVRVGGEVAVDVDVSDGRISACLDQSPGFRKTREAFIQILVFGLFGHRESLSRGSRSHPIP